jgi:hypothetical protein
VIQIQFPRHFAGTLIADLICVQVDPIVGISGSSGNLAEESPAQILASPGERNSARGIPALCIHCQIKRRVMIWPRDCHIPAPSLPGEFFPYSAMFR